MIVHHPAHTVLFLVILAVALVAAIHVGCYLIDRICRITQRLTSNHNNQEDSHVE